jgi:hypothetical protein
MIFEYIFAKLYGAKAKQKIQEFLQNDIDRLINEATGAYTNKGNSIVIGKVSLFDIPQILYKKTDQFLYLFNKYKADSETFERDRLFKKEVNQYDRQELYKFRILTFYEFLELCKGNLENKLQILEHHPEFKQYIGFTYDLNPFNAYQNFLKKHYPDFVQFFFDNYILGVSEQDRERHSYIVGGSGSGKSELLKYLIDEYLVKFPKISVVLIEPHGDLSEQVARLKDIKKDKLVYFDPILDPNYTPIFNPFEVKNPTDTNILKATNQLVRVFELILKDTTLTANMESVLAAVIDTLLRIKDPDKKNFFELVRFLDDTRNDDLIELGKLNPNKAHREVFEYNYKGKNVRTKEAIMNKLHKLIANPIFINTTTGKSTIDLEYLILNGYTVIFSLSKGKIETETSDILGKLFLAKIQSIALAQAEKPEHQRQKVHLFIDEFHNYITPTIKEILRESRKYGFALTMAQQSAGQEMKGDMKDTVFANTKIKIQGSTDDYSPNLIKGADGIDLKVGQFMLKVGNKEATKIQTSQKLLKNKHGISAEQWQQLKQEQLKKYYVKINNNSYNTGNIEPEPPKDPQSKFYYDDF